MRHRREARIKTWGCLNARVLPGAAAFGHGHKLKDRGNYIFKRCTVKILYTLKGNI